MSLDSQHHFTKLKVRYKRPKDELPRGYSPYSSATYYNPVMGREIQKQLDTKLDMNDKSKGIMFPVNKFKSVNTIYQQIYQGWRWLIENGDTPDKKYANLRAQMSLRKEKDRVVVYWSNKGRPIVNGIEIQLSGMEVTMEGPEEVTNSWKDTILNWAANAPEGNTEEAKISLLQEEQQWLREYLMAFPSVVVVRCDNLGYKITKNTKLAQAIREERGEI